MTLTYPHCHITITPDDNDNNDPTVRRPPPTHSLVTTITIINLINPNDDYTHPTTMKDDRHHWHSGVRLAQSMTTPETCQCMYGMYFFFFNLYTVLIIASSQCTSSIQPRRLPSTTVAPYNKGGSRRICLEPRGTTMVCVCGFIRFLRLFTLTN